MGSGRPIWPARSARSSPAIFFLGREYSADDYVRMGAANLAVPHEQLEVTALEWAAEINAKSPTARRMLKYAFNLIDDGLVGQQLFAGERRDWRTRRTKRRGPSAFLDKRDPDWSGYPYPIDPWDRPPGTRTLHLDVADPLTLPITSALHPRRSPHRSRR